MATVKTCDYPECGAPATSHVSADAHHEKPFEGAQLISRREEADSCDAHRAPLRLILFERANAYLERDLPIHKELFRLKAEQIEIERNLRRAVTVRDSFKPGSDKYREYDAEVSDYSAQLATNEQVWNETQAQGNKPL
jgi:hypothetical protein